VGEGQYMVTTAEADTAELFQETLAVLGLTAHHSLGST
jgi:hypothetical protein